VKNGGGRGGTPNGGHRMVLRGPNRNIGCDEGGGSRGKGDGN